MNIVDYALLAAAALIVLSLFWGFIKKFAVKATTILINSAVGLLILFGLDKLLGFHIPIAFPTLLVCGLFGIPGVASLAILHFFNYI